MSVATSSDPDKAMAGMSTAEDSAKRRLKSLLEDPEGKWFDPDTDMPRDYKHIYQIIKKHPRLAMERFEGGTGPNDTGPVFPLRFLLATKAPLEAIQEVYEMNPKALRTPCKEGEYPLFECLTFDCSPEVLEFVLKKFPDAAAKPFDFGDGDEDLPLGFFLNRFRCSDFSNRTGWQVYFCQVVQLLYKAHNPCLWEKDNQQNSNMLWSSQLSQLLMNPSTPPSLLVWLAEKESEHTDSCKVTPYEDEFDGQALIQNLKHFVPMLKCDWLSIEGVEQQLDETFLGELFSQVKIPSSLGIYLEGFHATFSTGIDDLSRAWSTCQVKCLSLADVDMPVNDFGCLLKGFLSFPNLKQLCLATDSFSNCTAPILEFLEEATSLLFLTLVGMGLDTQKLCEALRVSNSRAYVMYHETEEETSEDHETEETSEENVGVAYHSAMNFHGRTKICAPEANQDVLVGCLCSILVGCLCYMRGRRHSPKMKVSLLYGLLREVPGLWAKASAHKKRPACDSMEQPSNKKMK